MVEAEELHALLKGPLKLGRGRAAKTVQLGEPRELTLDDLLAAQGSTMVQSAPTVKTLRMSHHMVARLLAKGAKPQEVSLITGYSSSRISILQADPAFIELTTYYAEMDEEQFSIANADMHKRLSALGFDAVETLHERLLEDPEAFETKTLLAVIEATADRTGHGKQSTLKVDHEYSLSDESLARVKAAAQAGREAAPADREALVRLASLRTAAEHSSPEEAEGGEAGGAGVREEGGEGNQEPTWIEGRFVVVPSVDPV